MVKDRVSDMITRIKNATAVKKDQVEVEYSSLNLAIANLLKEAGYLKEVTKKTRFNKNHLFLDIAYNDKGEAMFSDMQRVSKPSRRIYKKSDEIHMVKQGRGILVVSTPKGVMTDRQARKEKVGGEIMCKIW